MARYKPYDYDQLNMIPVSLENQLVPGTLEHTIHHIIEHHLDLSMFNERYRNDTTGRRAIDPKVLLKIVLLGYSRGMTTSRQLEKACRENIIFMAMSCGEVPDHSTIAHFVSSMETEITPIFTQVLLICEEESLLGGTHFSIDGLKLPSNASKEWSGKFCELKSKKESIEKKVKERIREHNEEDKGSKGKPKDETHESRLKKLKQKSEKIDKFLRENEPKQGISGKEVQSNITDNESAKMISSHGVIQGYNANALVDEKHQIIIHAQAFGQGQDSENIAPMLEGAKTNLQDAGWKEPLKDKVITADSSYFSIDNLQACEEYEVDAYIPDKGFRNRDPRLAEAWKYKRPAGWMKKVYKPKKGLFRSEDFKFDNQRGRLICPAGNAMYIRNRNFKLKEGYKGINYQAPKTACRNCGLRSKCLQNPKTESRQVYVFYEKRGGSLTDDMKQKIDTVDGRKTYSKRLAIVEPVFANIRTQKRMDRFTLCGNIKINIQWKLYCLVHNIEKINNYGSSYAV